MYPLPPEKVDSIYVTHSHLDHIGALPIFYQDFSPAIYSTDMTANSMRPMLKDSIKVMNLEGYPVRFTQEDIEKLYENMNTVKYGETIEKEGFKITPQSAGHIPGSTMWRFENSSSIMVTGDLYTSDSLLLKGAQPQKCDTLIIESTYAGKNHVDREAVRKNLREAIKNIVEGGGKVILPSFAMGRTQELIMSIADLPYNIATDGMGNLITNIYVHTPGYLRSEKGFRKALSNINEIRGRNMREAAIENDIIISTSGMLDGGPALGYIERLMNDPKSAIFMTGYQVEGTNGRQLMENGTLNIAGAQVRPKMKVEFFDMSAHAGHDDLVSFIKSCSPERIIFCHGEQREKMLEDLENFEIFLPMNGEEFSF
ncbi:mRNA 3'-end processing factor [mine drainage metagenome]|uniref:mRNA 3'-end processing factor n=1 Tax=mine drainage metagenome TaxID=410659 RepID=T1DAU4_9ZZZZ